MHPERLSELLIKIQDLRIAVLGDFAVDFYFEIDKNPKEYSIETNLSVHLAKKPRAYLGGAGNVAKNVAILGAKVSTFGIRGDDLFGREMMYQCTCLGIDHTNMRVLDVDTPTYTKPMEGAIESNRIDFGTCMDHTQTIASDLIDKLLSESFDWVIINEQFSRPLLHEEHLKNLQINHGLADLRSLGNAANHLPLKVNEEEFRHMRQDVANEISIMKWVNERNNPVLVTLGEKGMIYADSATFHHERALPTHRNIDTVGAGDMVVAAFSLARAAGASIPEACNFASLAVHISIHKVGETGSANPMEMKQKNDEYSTVTH